MNNMLKKIGFYLSVIIFTSVISTAANFFILSSQPAKAATFNFHATDCTWSNSYSQSFASGSGNSDWRGTYDGLTYNNTARIYINTQWSYCNSNDVMYGVQLYFTSGSNIALRVLCCSITG